MWRLNSCIPLPDSFDENRETSTPRNARRFPNVWFCFQSSQYPCPSGHQIPDPHVIVSRFPGSWSWSLVTAVILTPSWSWHWWQCHDSVMSSSTCPHPVCTLSINTLLLTPLHTKCLLFTLLYYTSNLFTRYLFSQAFVWCKRHPIRSQCWLSLTNERAGPDVIVTLHNIGWDSHSHIPRLVTINPSININSLLAPVSFISNFHSYRH